MHELKNSHTLSACAKPGACVAGVVPAYGLKADVVRKWRYQMLANLVRHFRKQLLLASSVKPSTAVGEFIALGPAKPFGCWRDHLNSLREPR